MSESASTRPAPAEPSMWPFDLAVQRVDYRLTFDRTERPRTFYPEELCGPDTPDARVPGQMQIAEWHQEAPLEVEDNDIPQEDWFDHFFSMAVNEAVHEALEHFRVDGDFYLDPHGQLEHQIYTKVNALADALSELRRSAG